MVRIGFGGWLAAKTEKAQDLTRKLVEASKNLEAESSEHDSLRTTIGLVMDDLGMTSPQGTNSLVVCALSITDRACELARDALQLSVQWAFAVARTHYESIDLMSKGFMPGYTDDQMDDIEEKVVPLARSLVEGMEEEILPRKG
jgi:hypothetical protein